MLIKICIQRVLRDFFCFVFILTLSDSCFPQEAVVQYEQYEQEVKNLQRLIEEAHRIIQDRPVSTNNIQELQAQIHHHEVRAVTLYIISE